MARNIIRTIKGMHDDLPGWTEGWRWIEDEFRALASGYGYGEIRFPLLEKTELFKRSIGEVTDIVEKEMFGFMDSGGDHVSLRPEGTAGCVRAAEQHGLLYNRQQRLWYQGPMFRRERPQKGRSRQFFQFGVEAFGMAGPDIDAEIIEISAEFWQRLGLADYVRLELNNIGNAEDRRRYGAVLAEYLTERADELDPAARSRIASNPMRVLDSKHPGNRAVAQDAPAMPDFLSPDSVEHYEELKRLLDAAGIVFEENNSLVRGLDYYNNCVFEWTTDRLGAQSAVCGGGRYDGLVSQLGGRSTPAAGFAIGVERALLLFQETRMAHGGVSPFDVSDRRDVRITVYGAANSAKGQAFAHELQQRHEELRVVCQRGDYGIDIYIVVPGDVDAAEGQRLARELRNEIPGLRVTCNNGGGKNSQQVKRAWEQKARFVAVLVQVEAGQPQQVTLRSLDDSFEATTVRREYCVHNVVSLMSD